MASFHFQLFILGDQHRSVAVIRSIHEILGGYPGLRLEVIDVLKRPDLAERYRILATPALVRLLPLPSVRLIGDMTDRESIERLLDVKGETAGACN